MAPTHGSIDVVDGGRVIDIASILDSPTRLIKWQTQSKYLLPSDVRDFAKSAALTAAFLHLVSCYTLAVLATVECYKMFRHKNGGSKMHSRLLPILLMIGFLAFNFVMGSHVPECMTCSDPGDDFLNSLGLGWLGAEDALLAMGVFAFLANVWSAFALFIPLLFAAIDMGVLLWTRVRARNEKTASVRDKEDVELPQYPRSEAA